MTRSTTVASRPEQSRTTGIRNRIPYNALATLVRNPRSFLSQAVGLATLERELAAYLSVDAEVIRNWRRHLVVEVGLQNLLAENVRDIRARRDGFSIGGGLGPANEVLYYFIRASQPRLVVETGVAHGFSSAYILQALEDNQAGHLYSIDLPNTNSEGFVDADGTRDRVFVDSVESTGAAIPQHLRARWTLRLGPSDPNLTDLLAELGEVDVFFHDSEHSFKNMMWEYHMAWPHIRPHGYLLSDDVSQNTAFRKFELETGVAAFRWLGSRGRRGAIRHP